MISEQDFLQNLSYPGVGSMQDRSFRFAQNGYRNGRWSTSEHLLFLEGLLMHGRNFKKISEIIQHRTVIHVRTHAQKFFLKKKALAATFQSSKSVSNSLQPREDAQHIMNEIHAAVEKRESAIACCKSSEELTRLTTTSDCEIIRLFAKLFQLSEGPIVLNFLRAIADAINKVPSNPSKYLKRLAGLVNDISPMNIIVDYLEFALRDIHKNSASFLSVIDSHPKETKKISDSKSSRGIKSASAYTNPLLSIAPNPMIASSSNTSLMPPSPYQGMQNQYQPVAPQQQGFAQQGLYPPNLYQPYFMGGPPFNPYQPFPQFPPNMMGGYPPPQNPMANFQPPNMMGYPPPPMMTNYSFPTIPIPTISAAATYASPDPSDKRKVQYRPSKQGTPERPSIVPSPFDPAPGASSPAHSFGSTPYYQSATSQQMQPPFGSNSACNPLNAAAAAPASSPSSSDLLPLLLRPFPTLVKDPALISLLQNSATAPEGAGSAAIPSEASCFQPFPR